MDDGTDKSCGSEQPMVTEIESDDARRAVVSSALCPSTVSTQAIGENVAELEAANEWDSYIESQTRHDWVDLDLKERSFCDEYLVNGYKHLDAAEYAGYARKAGSRLLNKPLLREYMLWSESKRRMRRLVSEHILDAKLTDLYDQAVGEVDINMIDKDGVEFTGKKFHGQLALSILQEQGKISGVSKPEIQEGAGGVQVIIDVAGLLGTKHEIKEIN